MTSHPIDEAPAMRLLHRVDAELRRLSYVRTSPAALKAAAFLDGRTTFWAGVPETVGFADALPPPGRMTRERFIFHLSFCGSTVLASVLGDACDALVLKEPHCLVDLADWKAGTIGRAGDPDLPAVLTLARSALRGLDARPVVIKPSNWVNNLLPELSAATAGAAQVPLQVQVTMARPAFIAAVFRGGRDRLAFTARVASHLAGAFERGPALVQSAVAASPEPLGRVANLSALAHALQLRLFDEAASRLPAQAVQRIDFEEIGGDLEAAVRKAARGLLLPLDESALRRAVAEWRQKDPKRPGARFSRAAQDRASADVERLHAGAIGAALAWSERLPELVLKENRNRESAPVK